MAYIYVLQCEDECWYVGMTTNLESRISRHFCNSGGSRWTRTHKPLSVYEVIKVDTEQKYVLEDTKTIEYIKKFGIDKVRGGSYCNAKNREYLMRTNI